MGLRGRATLVKPPTPWLPPQRDWRATRVISPWVPLVRRESVISYWNGEATLGGPFPQQITARGKPLLAAPIRLASGDAAEWESPRVSEEQPHRIAITGTGKLGRLSAPYTTLMDLHLRPMHGQCLARVRLLRPPVEPALRRHVLRLSRDPRTHARRRSAHHPGQAWRAGTRGSLI
jgi:hypothetical protein